MPSRIIPAIALFAALLTQGASAAESGIMNQANPLEATLRFYAHPAHLYWSNSAPRQMSEHPAVVVKRHASGQSAGGARQVPHPALAQRVSRVVVQQASAAVD
jgi:hypothetical protein